jgi:hypothetical protein
VARKNREEEEAMARAIAAKWKKVVELTLKEEDIRVPSRAVRKRAR